MTVNTVNFVAELNHYGVISLSGEQAQEYLQGQVTIDVGRLSENKSRYGCHCDFKGKTWNAFLALQDNDGYQLISDKSCIPQSLAELKKYGVFSKVDIVDESEKLNIVGVVGADAIESLQSIFTKLPQQNLAVLKSDFGNVICIDVDLSAYLLVLTSDGKAKLDANLPIGMLKDQAYWEAVCIQLGIPVVREATVNEFVPQMMNMQAIEAIDFDKGCYMGQEVVARTKFLGRNKRASFILKSEEVLADSSIAAGKALEKQAGENWRSGGTILRGASLHQTSQADSNGTWLLAVLANDTQVGDVLRLKELPEHQFTVQSLPYEIKEQTSKQ
ncbi:tRNA-modifying protein YgfZ [Glaciecola sp. KUL10]|uniref:tRNA-modifying protein YgfZ n=1 Tax=Glaciecola sp. (strain KUL10) TaxID=2161813 RepID=UPI000D782124|nr:tRNA-modifying protein YgfZ [Glaciecola sp. KUL10]GBL04698.1 tRNA-modifying protein ygfZ [Glaciecola sp. KUL10]